MQDWDKLRIFHAVAEAGSFTRAGERLGMSQSAVSRQISTLEYNLSSALFIRHARGLMLTEAGEQLFNTVQKMAWELESAQSRITENREAPSGPLVVTTTIGFGSTWLTSRIQEFLELFPNIQVEIRLNDDELDLAMRQADVAIRLHRPVQSDLIQRKLFTVHFHVYASTKYIEKNGQPQTVEDLDDHAIMSFGRPTPAYLGDINWLEKAGRPENRPRVPVLRVNSIYGLMRAARHGIGIALLPDYITSDIDTLVKIPPENDLPAFETYFVYQPEMRKSARVAAFRDFLVSKSRVWSY